MDIDELNTGVLLFDGELLKIQELNPAAQKILGWNLSSLNDNINDLGALSQGLAALAKLIRSLKSEELREEIKQSKSKRIEIKINSQHFNLYLQQLEDDYMLELSQIIYQDMKQSTHELKRPIQNIKTLVETLLLGAKDDAVKAQEYLEKLDHEADRLGTMVQDMLSLSHVLSGSVELNKIELDLGQLADKLINSAESRAASRKISLSNEIPKATKIFADKKYLDHLLANLIDNGIKYNRDGGKVQLHYKEGVLTVEDTGTGIPETDIAKVFDQFYRVQASSAIQGTGLGLAIVKAIVDLHGWTIEIESELNTGSRFLIRLS
ncbi:MAG: HAMP domain-containing sensor histidine kinase [Cyanobacteria bacterium]|nr:HAMP domain-containing sensor histidine kinase [Cyanobacteriota bacterium]